jgi:hypothetical protein
MSTFFNFNPQPLVNFQFTPTLDGVSYTAIVPWLLFGQRWYLSLLALNGELIFNRSLIGSPSGVSIEGLSWETGYVNALTSAPHGYQVGQTIELTLSGSLPVAYDGIYECVITGPNTFSYPLASDPGLPSSFGNVNYNVNLAWGYFDTSVMVYRPATQQFEVTP